MFSFEHCYFIKTLNISLIQTCQHQSLIINLISLSSDLLYKWSSDTEHNKLGSPETNGLLKTVWQIKCRSFSTVSALHVSKVLVLDVDHVIFRSLSTVTLTFLLFDLVLRSLGSDVTDLHQMMRNSHLHPNICNLHFTQDTEGIIICNPAFPQQIIRECVKHFCSSESCLADKYLFNTSFIRAARPIPVEGRPGGKLQTAEGAVTLFFSHLQYWKTHTWLSLFPLPLHPSLSLTLCLPPLFSLSFSSPLKPPPPFTLTLSSSLFPFTVRAGAVQLIDFGYKPVSQSWPVCISSWLCSNPILNTFPYAPPHTVACHLTCCCKSLSAWVKSLEIKCYGKIIYLQYLAHSFYLLKHNMRWRDRKIIQRNYNKQHQYGGETLSEKDSLSSHTLIPGELRIGECVISAQLLRASRFPRKHTVLIFITS